MRFPPCTNYTWFALPMRSFAIVTSWKINLHSKGAIELPPSRHTSCRQAAWFAFWRSSKTYCHPPKIILTEIYLSYLLNKYFFRFSLCSRFVSSCRYVSWLTRPFVSRRRFLTSKGVNKNLVLTIFASQLLATVTSVSGMRNLTISYLL